MGALLMRFSDLQVRLETEEHSRTQNILEHTFVAF